MNGRRFIILVALTSSGYPALAQSTAQPSVAPTVVTEVSTAGVQDIIVTAQKRSQSVNRVGMSITAVSGDALMKQGVLQTSDLGKIAAGFTFAQTPFGSPVYSIRGVGFYETSLAATPAVTVYTDEVALPYPQMTRFSGFDIERVEILKGPQGTLFGQNATGGAINYIAAKPTDEFKAGIDGSFSRFATADWSGFVGGPVTNTLDVRVAVKAIEGGDWQKSYTTGDTRGQKDTLQGRVTATWKPASWLHSTLSVNGWRDRSDTTAYQLLSHFVLIPSLTSPAFFAYPLAPHNDRAADWTSTYPKRRNDKFYQIALRNEVDLTDRVKLTAITAYTHIKIDDPIDSDGTSLQTYQLDTRGHTNSFSQEVRLSGDFGQRGHWIVGGNYGHDKTFQSDIVTDPEDPIATVFGPQFSADNYDFFNGVKARTLAAFANVEYPLTEKLSVQGGVRYTSVHTDYSGCSTSTPQDSANGTSAAFASFINALRSASGLPADVVIQPGQCIDFNPATLEPEFVNETLREHNVSWRANLNYQLDPGKLLYVNVSKGYKAGNFANIGASVTTQYTPAKQETLLSYEAGFKLSLFDHKIQLNGAGFYYDYSNKQLRGTVLDPILGSLSKLLNVPKSHVVGGEVQLIAQPVTGLHLSVNGTYLQSRVDKHYLNFTPYGVPVDFKGERFPYTPKWSINADGEYDFPLSDHLKGFFGGSVQYQSTTTTAFGGVPIFKIPSYALVDLRAGVNSPNDKWRLSIWGKNVFNKYYFTSVSYVSTANTIGSTGMPGTYGVTMSVRF